MSRTATDTVSEIIVDFIANLMHLGEAINFRVLDEESAVIPLVRIAAVHFNAETKSSNHVNQKGRA
nr:hypothetical protein [Klebsiella pneumoniae]